MRAVIADDEPELASQLRRELARLWPDLEIVGVAASGTQALALLERERPDVAFLDIRMPGLSGLEVAGRLCEGCRVVFVTAFDQYAVEAFERNAVDYLLKPVTPERLGHTVERLRRQASAQREPAELAALLQRLQAKGQEEYLRWIRVGRGERVELVSVEDVVYFQAHAKYTSVVTGDADLVIRTAIKTLAEQLDPQRFWRIHRATIVNAGAIAAVHRGLGGRFTVALKNRPEHLTVSRAYAQQFRQM